MKQGKMLSHLRRLYNESERFTSDDDAAISKWASAVDPILESINHTYIIMFRSYCFNKYYDASSGLYKYNIDRMREQVLNGIRALELSIEQSKDDIDRQYYGINSQFDIQVAVASIIQAARISICIVDSYMDEKILNELTQVMAPELKLLTTNPSELFKQRLEAFKKSYPDKNIEVHTDKRKRLHDRFFLIDKEKVYTLGASLKNAGDRSTTLSLISQNDDIEKLISDFELIWSESEKLA